MRVERRGRLVEQQDQRPSRIIVRPSASFCHWPPDSSLPFDHDRPSGVSRPVGQRARRRRPRARVERVLDHRRRSRFGRSPTPTVSRARTSMRAKSWKPAVRLSRHSARSKRRMSSPSSVIAPARRLVEAADQLDERRLAGAVLAHERDDRAGRQAQVDVAQDRPRRSRGTRTRRPRTRALPRSPRARAGRPRARLLARDALAQPVEPVDGAHQRLHRVREQDDRRRLDRDLRREDRREQHGADRLRAADRALHDERERGDVADHEHELAARARGRGAAARRG